MGASWSIESFFSFSVEPFFSFQAFLQDTLSGSLLFRLALGSVASLLPLQTTLPFLFSSYDFLLIIIVQRNVERCPVAASFYDLFVMKSVRISKVGMHE